MKKHSIKTNLFSIVLTIIIICGAFPLGGFAEDAILGGSGTAESPYLIGTAAELKAFRDIANEDGSVHGKLTADIDLKNEEWKPFNPSSGYVSDAYSGTFDGGYHTVRGLYIKSSFSNQGLFGIVNGGTIKNLNIEGTIESSNSYIGGIVGKLQSGTIDSCSFSGAVASTKASSAYAGGIVGGNQNNSTIKNCCNRGTVTGYAGGIIGIGKQLTVENCFNIGKINGTTRAGGIAGQLDGASNVKNCYNIGTLSLSSENYAYSGGVSGYNGIISNCCWTTTENGTGNNTGTLTECEYITSAEGLAEKLGAAYTEDVSNINGGYPVLTWQLNAAPVQKNPRIEIKGGGSMSMTNDGYAPTKTLTVEYKDMEDMPPIEWSLKDDNGVIRLDRPNNSTEKNSTVIVTALNPGKAIVTAVSDSGTYSAEAEISVLPFITTVAIDGIPAVGRTVSARVNILRGTEYDYENYPELSYQWRFLTEEDYSLGNTSSYKEIKGASERELTITEDLAGGYLSFSVLAGGETKIPNTTTRVKSFDEGMVYEDKTVLIMDESDIKAPKSLKLPKAGKNGSIIEWTSSNNVVIDAGSGDVMLPADGIMEITLTAKLTYNTATAEKTFKIKVYSAKSAEEEKTNKRLILQKIILRLGDYYKITPSFGKDTNVLEILKADVAKIKNEITEENVNISLAEINEIYGGAEIASNGDIAYFYTDPNTIPTIKFGRIDVSFNLELEDASEKVTVPVIIYWDIDKVKEAMKKEISDKVILDTSEALTENISLPKIIDDKKWAVITWKSDDENALFVSCENQQTADTLFNPYVGTVKRGKADKKVTLTAEYTFMYTNAAETPITLSDTFDVTVKALDEAAEEQIKEQLSERFTSGFDKTGISDAVTGEKLTFDNDTYTTCNDIKIPSSKDFGVDGKYYPITITSSNEMFIKSPDVNNTARIEVYRPAIGAEPVTVEITVSMLDRYTDVSVSKTFKIKVMPLIREEADKEKALMNKVISSYFDGIKGQNTEKDNISKDLSAFVEVYEKDGELVWVRSNTDKVNYGIVPIPLEGWEELEAWRLFKSSNPAAISHENLSVSIQNNAKAVTVSSALSSEALGKYGKLYKSDPDRYKDYEEFADLYYREVSENVVVRGKVTQSSEKPAAVEEKINVFFNLRGAAGDLIEKTEYKNLDETTTVFDIFKKALSKNGFSYTSKGTYITSVITDDGTEIKEFDAGNLSGWMYKVNGKIPDVSMGACGLKDGDKVIVFFTKDYTKEFGFTYSKSSGKTPTKNVEAKSDEKIDDKNISSSPLKFKDVKDGDWYYSAVEYVCGRKIMEGFSEDEFSPDSSLTRAMIVTVLYRLAGEPEVLGDNNSFDDVEEDSWYRKSVLWAYQNDIINGYDNGFFGPDDEITREQLATVIYRYSKYKKYDNDVKCDITDYSDYAEISEYAAAAFEWANANGIISGSESKLMPAQKATRAQIAAIIMRFITAFED